jgi:hypothetical protein
MTAHAKVIADNATRRLAGDAIDAAEYCAGDQEHGEAETDHPRDGREKS